MSPAAATKQIEIPYFWEARPYQYALWDYLLDGGKRALCVWHRRAGKDLTALNWTVQAAITERVGTYYHLFPTYNQGKKVIWDGKDKSGRPFLSYWPQELLKGSPNETEMRVELVNGSAWQVVGVDKIDNVVGTNPVGCVFSEFSLQKPEAWELLRPILAENGGWAMFIYTPRGRNHAYKMHMQVESDPAWFTQVLTVNDTGAITEADIEAERKSGMSEELIQQEFYCSYNAPQFGAYYGSWMTDARREGRIGRVPHDKNLLVHTFWDLGIDDYMAIWFVQFAGQEVHAIDYYQMQGEGLEHYAGILDRKGRDLGYKYGEHWAPHDIEARELGSGLSRKETAHNLGIDFRVVPRTQNIMDDIDIVRGILPRSWFDEARCEPGIAALENYRKEWLDKLQVFSERPLHDQYSHGADAYRTLARAIKLGAGGSVNHAAVKAELARLKSLYRRPY